MELMSNFVRLQIKNKHIAYLSIERAEAYNALSRQVADELDKAFDAVAGNTAVRVLVIKSSKNFASGADIGEMAALNAKEAASYSFGGTFQKLADLSIPTLAAIEGYALGGGLELALACDLRIAAEDAKLGFPEITLGIMPGAGGTFRLPRLVGEAKAKELIFLGKKITAGQALDMGLVNMVVSGSRFEETVDALAQCLSFRSVPALAAAKKAVEEGSGKGEPDKLWKKERERWAALFDGADQKEGMRAFLEKRIPSYEEQGEGGE